MITNFAELVQSFYENYIGQSARSLIILKNASENHKYILNRIQKSKSISLCEQNIIPTWQTTFKNSKNYSGRRQMETSALFCHQTS